MRIVKTWFTVSYKETGNSKEIFIGLGWVALVIAFLIWATFTFV